MKEKRGKKKEKRTFAIHNSEILKMFSSFEILTKIRAD
ncbi:MAG: hypothetical protein ACI81T_002057 [Bacteroidia bacterium]|jgi:hypothetical protein